MNIHFDHHFQDHLETFNSLRNDSSLKASLSRSIEVLINCFQSGGHLYSCGNGGSMSDAIHLAEELTGRYKDNRPSLPAMAISDPGYLSCVFNDYGQEYVFSRFLEGWGRKGDVLVAISTSGKSPNIIQALQLAEKKQMQTIALLGKDGGQAKNLTKNPIIVPSQNTERIQEMHGLIIHVFIESIERHFFPENYS